MAYAILLALGWDPVEAIDLIRQERGIAAVGYAEDALDWNLQRIGADDCYRPVGGASEMAAEPRSTCCEHAMRPIVYGHPGEDLIEATDDGRAVLGGCVVDHDMPAFECSRCGRTVGRIDEAGAHMADDDWWRRGGAKRGGT